MSGDAKRWREGVEDKEVHANGPGKLLMKLKRAHAAGSENLELGRRVVGASITYVLSGVKGLEGRP